MNKIRINRLLGGMLTVGIFLFLSTETFAQDLVKLPTGPASWTVDITISGPKEDKSAEEESAKTTQNDTNTPTKNNPPTAKLEVRQDNEKIRYLTTSANGLQSVVWALVGANLLLTTAPNGVTFFTDQGAVPFGVHAFDWLHSNNLQEKKPVFFKSKKCFHYKGSQMIGYSHDKPKMITFEAWIDSKTLLPVALLIDNQLGIFTFSNLPPDGSLVIPDKYAKLFEKKKLIMGLK